MRHPHHFGSRMVAFLLIILLSWFFTLTWLAIKLSDPRKPVLFRQTRIGFAGKEFGCWKVRTMQKCDHEQLVTEAQDGRITKIGRWLRMSHLDELIQLLNVLEGTMVFIGPRPAIPEIYRKRTKEEPEYVSRTDVFPGITGLQQVTGRVSATRIVELDKQMLSQMTSKRFRAWVIWRTVIRVATLAGE